MYSGLLPNLAATNEYDWLTPTPDTTSASSSSNLRLPSDFSRFPETPLPSLFPGDSLHNPSVSNQIHRSDFTPVTNDTAPAYPFTFSNAHQLQTPTNTDFFGHVIPDPALSLDSTLVQPQSAKSLLQMYTQHQIQRRPGIKSSWELECPSCLAWVNTGISVQTYSLQAVGQFATLESHMRSKKCSTGHTVRLGVQAVRRENFPAVAQVPRAMSAPPSPSKRAVSSRRHIVMNTPMYEEDSEDEDLAYVNQQFTLSVINFE